MWSAPTGAKLLSLLETLPRFAARGEGEQVSRYDFRLERDFAFARLLLKQVAINSLIIERIKLLSLEIAKQLDIISRSRTFSAVPVP